MLSLFGAFRAVARRDFSRLPAAAAARGMSTLEEGVEWGCCEAMMLEGEAPRMFCWSEGSVCLEGELEGRRRGLLCRCSSGGLLGAEEDASAALRDIFKETKRAITVEIQSRSVALIRGGQN